MALHSLVSTFGSLLHEHSGLGYFVDLLSVQELYILLGLCKVFALSRQVQLF